ncbi:Hypothetical_protein [Hexamita inflata]|uniref:Hypothetical_protein n=1 Tax=Hexamita inflata TaxID=28002 RepID=A0AA86Q924_9EUKA|nr:Hypothetical protein HINF_LOCUS35665 [Hexamita inflata]
MEPIDITNMSVSELKALLQEDDFDQKSLKMIKNRIKRLTILEEMQRIMPNFEAIIQQETNQKKKLTIQEEMQRMMPNFEAIEEDYKQKIQNKNIQLEQQIKQYDIEEVNNYLQQQKQNKGIIRFEGDFNRFMVKYHLDDIMKFYNGKFIRIYYRDEEDKTMIFVYPIKKRLIQMITNSIYKGINLQEKETDSDQELQRKMLHAYKIEILTAENVFNKNLLENEKKLDDIDKYVKEKQKQRSLVRSLDLKSNKKNKGAYFNFINKIPQIDLSRYQIGNNLQQHLELSRKSQCFIYALQMSGQYSNQELQAILVQVQSNLQLFSLTQIKNIKHIGPICIHIYEEQSKQVRIYDVKGDILWCPSQL